MKRESAFLGFGLVAVAALGAAVALARCSGSEARPAQSTPRVPVSAGPSEAASSEPAAVAAAQQGKSLGARAPGSGAAEDRAASGAAPVFDASAEAPLPGGAASRINRALATSHPADLKLLGSIERELRREPPPEVHAMLRRRSEGATRDELLGMARALPELQLRVLALGWVDDVRPVAPGTRRPAVPTPGSAMPFVKPIRRAP